MNVFRDSVYPLLGLAMLVYGAWKIYHPAAFIVAGVVCLLISLVPRKPVKP